jgi:hypothetical protein
MSIKRWCYDKFFGHFKEFGGSHFFKFPWVIAYEFACSLPKHLGILKKKKSLCDT